MSKPKVKKELSFGVDSVPSIIINSYPVHGRGILINDGRKDFNHEVRNFCTREHSLTEEENSSRAEKVIVVGDHSVGKTSLVRRYAENIYTDGYKATIGVDFIFRKYNILGRDFTLHIWDTAGQEQFRCVSKSYFRGAMAVIAAFDLSNPETIKTAKEWLEDVVRENSPDMLIFLIGTKCDLFHLVSPEMALDMATQLKAEYWETSAKNDINVNDMFERLAVSLFESSILRTIHVSSNTKFEIGSSKLLLGDTRKVDKPEKKCCLF